MSPAVGAPMVRAALSFTVLPESVDEISAILRGYPRPALVVDQDTRLLRTSVFLHGNRVVRVVDVQGDLGAALRHLAAQPRVRRVEERLNPHLTEPRDLTDPQAARAFFTRAMLRATRTPSMTGAARPRRDAYLLPLGEGSGEQAAKMLASVSDTLPPEVEATVLHREDVLVWLIESEGGEGADAMRRALTTHQEALADLLDADPANGNTPLLERCHMSQITDRVAEEGV
ncbi:SchA/CurD-like domain-containing protein [Nocardiopsis alba]|uniref:SchA/CurD-like domain-containing protein n=2 Tax=Nocardiopsidaceae TaxID=83676 RepID=UPI00366F9D96